MDYVFKSPEPELTPEQRKEIFYVNQLFDLAIGMWEKEKKKNQREFYILLLVYEGNVAHAIAAWHILCHAVSECPREVITFLEKLLTSEHIALPWKPETMTR